MACGNILTIPSLTQNLEPMNEDLKNKNSVLPEDLEAMDFRLSKGLLEWLGNTTVTCHREVIPNRELFRRLLAMMQISDKNSGDFYRVVATRAGQAQISENRLASEWRMGRKQLHAILSLLSDLGAIRLDSSRTATVVTFLCVRGWTLTDGVYVTHSYPSTSI